MGAKTLSFSPRCGLGAVAIFPLPFAALLFFHPRLPESIWFIWAGVTIVIASMFIAGVWLAARLKTAALVFCAVAGVFLTAGQLSYIVHRSNEALAQNLRDIARQERERKMMMEEVRKIAEPNQPPQRNAGSRPSSDDTSAPETPSSLLPRG
jgi:hypothetical protein